MILLDTHIWLWWASRDSRLTPERLKAIEAHTESGVGVSIISCWEVAQKVQTGKLVLDRPVEEWFDLGLTYPGVRLLGLTPAIVLESTRLPGTFHRDPADQIIVATARVLGVPLLTADERILQYPHVGLVVPP